MWAFYFLKCKALPSVFNILFGPFFDLKKKTVVAEQVKAAQAPTLASLEPFIHRTLTVQHQTADRVTVATSK